MALSSHQKINNNCYLLQINQFNLSNLSLKSINNLNGMINVFKQILTFTTDPLYVI